MFSRFAAVIYNAVDALAPPLPLQEDFIWHWKSVTKFFTSKNVSNKIPIEVTSIPGHLLEMLEILEQEQKELEIGSIGACMEYIIDHKLFETMHVLGTADSPPGMKRHMLLFASRLLKMMQSFLIPHASMYIPITKFIELCGEVIGAPTEKEEIGFLEVICSRSKDNPHLINCFVGLFNEQPGKNPLHRSLPNNTDRMKPNDPVKECTLINSLLNMFHSPDHSISVRASECLLICCTLANDSAAVTIVQNSNFCRVMCHCLAQLYNNLSNTMKLSDITEPVDLTSENPGIQSMSPDRRRFLCYLRHLSFLDALFQQSHPVIGKNCSETLRAEFLEVVIHADLVSSQNEDVHLFATTLISSSLQYASSTLLTSTFATFLLGETNSFEISGHPSHVKDLLIQRCQRTKDNAALCMATLQLFEELLHKPSQFVLQNLAINYLEGRGYFDHTVVDNYLEFSDDDSLVDYTADEPMRSHVGKSLAPAYMNRLLESFLSLVPDDMKSAETEEDSGYDTYVKEAHGRFMQCLSMCEDFDWPTEPLCKEEFHLCGDDSSSDSQPEADSMHWKFYEGPFLSMIFDNIEHMLDLPYDINLQLTALISRLVLFAHPNLHEYLLNPLLPNPSRTRTLFSVLSKVVEDIKGKVVDIKSFKQKIRITRKSLLSDDNVFEPVEESNLLEVLIVIEEFSKELAAIAFVKYHVTS